MMKHCAAQSDVMMMNNCTSQAHGLMMKHCAAQSDVMMKFLAFGTKE
jgi:hypothetical protein